MSKPQILFFQINRIQIDSNSTLVKLNTSFDFPLEFNIREFMDWNDKPTNYSDLVNENINKRGKGFHNDLQKLDLSCLGKTW